MRVLVCTDGSPYSDHAIDFVADLFCDAKDIEIECITVIDPAAGTELEMLIESVDELTKADHPAAVEAKKMLDDCERRFGQHDTGPGVSFSTKVLAGPPERLIVETAEKWEADLIVLGPHGRGFIQSALFGSVTERVLHHARCPVLVVQ